MHANHPLGLSLLFIVLGSLSAQADDSPSLSTLNEKGLIKSGLIFVIEAEKPVLAKMKEVRTITDSYAKLAERQAVVEQIALHLTQLEERRIEFQDNLNDLNQRINERVLMFASGPNGRLKALQIIAE